VEQHRVEYEEFIEEQSQSQGRNMQLEENQVSLFVCERNDNNNITHLYSAVRS